MARKDGEYCGNCDSHNSFHYPTKIFCSTRHGQNLDPIVDTLGYCDSYSRVSQECYCVREALKAQNDQEKAQR